MRRKGWIALAVVLLLVVVAVAGLWLFEFRLAFSNTAGDHQMSTYSTGEEEEQVAGLPGSTVALAVADEGAMAPYLEAELRKALLEEPDFDEVEILDAAPDSVPSQYLLATVSESQVTWTPFYGVAAVTVEVAYSSNGDLTWREETPVTLNNEDGAVVWARGTFALADRSWGLISRPAYYRLLATGLAEQIGDSVAESAPGS
jgi:hypothetical protein